MFAPSRRRAPLALVALALSEPARSIRLILAMQTFWLRLAVLSCCLKYIWGTEEKNIFYFRIKLRSRNCWLYPSNIYSLFGAGLKHPHTGFLEKLQWTTWNTAWDREEVAFISVGCCVLFRLPESKASRMCSADLGWKENTTHGQMQWKDSAAKHLKAPATKQFDNSEYRHLTFSQFCQSISFFSQVIYKKMF